MGFLLFLEKPSTSTAAQVRVQVRSLRFSFNTRINQLNYLSSHFPKLSGSFTHIDLGDFPTPVENFTLKDFDRDRLYIKRDDISGKLYGGNKVRKLEYLLSEALEKKAKYVITSGAVGSNHCLATARYASSLGFKPVLMLFGDQTGDMVRTNLLADYMTGAVMYYDRTYEEHLVSMKKAIALYREIGKCEPYIIPAGGTSHRGILGYVNAAFELKDQIDKGILPEPDTIFIPLGTMGTAAGLYIGLKAAGLNCKIAAVQVVASFVADKKKLAALIESASSFFNALDNTFPIVRYSDNDINVGSTWLGQGYGISTPQAENAIKKFKTADVSLDPTYSGKCAAAFLDFVKREENRHKTVLFWNTKNSVKIDVSEVDYRKLPEGFWWVFDNGPRAGVFDIF